MKKVNEIKNSLVKLILTYSKIFFPSWLHLQLHRGLKAFSVVKNRLFFGKNLQKAWMADYVLNPHMLSLHIETTNICNADCVFCAYSKMNRPKITMKDEVFGKLLTEISKQNKRVQVSLTPIVGDPFLDKQLFERVRSLYSLTQVYEISMFTNAIQMTREKIDSVRQYSDKLHIAVSWGGNDSLTWSRIMGVDGFEKALANLMYLIETLRQGAEFSVQLNLRCPREACSGKVWDQLIEAETLGLIKINPEVQFDSWAGLIPSENLKAHGLKSRPAPLKIGPCKLLYFAPVALADGRVNACAARDLEGELIVGNVKEDPFFQIFGGEKHLDLIKRQSCGDFPEVCKRCTYYVSIFDGVPTFV